MRRVAITGIGCLTPAGNRPDSIRDALAAGVPFGEERELGALRGRTRKIRIARIAPIDRESILPARKLRRMGGVSQLWTISCLLARADAGLADPDRPAPPPDRRGVFLGTGFGCLMTTWECVSGIIQDGLGAANPYLFSESVANAPAGHCAIELDARGLNLTLTCGDASAAAAVESAARAVAEGRLDVAYAGGVEEMVEPLRRALADLGAPAFLGEGSVCLVLEPLDSAIARGARIYAEIAGGALGSDPRAPANAWSRDSEPMRNTMRRALDRAVGSGRERFGEIENAQPPEVRRVFLHACGNHDSEAAERSAVAGACPGASTGSAHPVFGAFAAAGGINIAAAALEILAAGAEGRAGDSRERAVVLVHAHSWGGGNAALVLSEPR